MTDPTATPAPVPQSERRAAPRSNLLASGQPLWKIYLAFLGPMVLSNILQALSGTFNGVFIGQMLGTQALAAVSGMFPIVFFFISLIIGVGAGSSILIGQAIGARDPHKVKVVAGAALALGLSIGLVVALFGGFFTDVMLRLLRTPPDIMEEAHRYAQIMMLAMPGLLTFILLTQLLRGVGDTVTSMNALILSGLTSAFLTPALIRGWLGLPQLGVASAAVASMVSFVVALGFMVWKLRRIASPLAPDAELLRALRVHVPTLKLVLRLGLPTAVQMITISLAEVVLLGLVNGYGADAVAAYGAVNQIVNYVQFPALSIGISASILGAQAIGAGQTARLPEILRTGYALNLAITGTLIALGYVFARPLLGLFITRPEVLDVAQTLLHVMLWSLLVFGFGVITSSVMRSSGMVIAPTAVGIACIIAVELPAAWLMSGWWGLKGVWLAYPVTFCTMWLGYGLLYHYVWRQRDIRRLV